MKRTILSLGLISATCLGFVSCNKNDLQTYTQEQIIEAQYKEAFVKTFGQPASNQDWGFAKFKSATTRSIVDVNGNLWKETPECTPAEADLVFNYVNMTRAQMTTAGHVYTEELPKNIENYFVTQVYTGTDTYSTFDGTSTGILGSSKMNHLNIAMTSDAAIVDGALTGAEGSWNHINNFNAGSNMNYGGNTLVVDGGTYDFAYLCSEDSRYHNKWIAINGADVDASLAGKYYICFDFIAENPDAYTNFRFKVPGKNAGEWTEKGPIAVPGCWTVETATAAGLEITYTDWVWDGHQSVPQEKTVIVGGENTKDWKIDNVVGGNKVIPANDVYTDWIVRIVEAEPDVVPVCRIIAEDLSASSGSDFDFNDVVFDVAYNEDKTIVTVQAAGGTLPLFVAGKEVHQLFMAANPNAGITETTMINTKASNGKSGLDPVSFTIDGLINPHEIAIVVNKNGSAIPLKAEVGVPAAKIAVDPSFVWCDERADIREVYPNFSNYVKDTSVNWY